MNTVNAEKKPLAAAIMALILRLHFYIGLFVGPFIFIAALTGTLYVLTPQIEDRLYANQLYVDAPGTAQPLAAQVAAAQATLAKQPSVQLIAVRPAPTPRDTSRVLFRLPESGPSEYLAVFVNPATLAIQGQLMVYGTSGILPLRTWLDHLHQGLLLGSVGRIYSELAASWLWVAALGGVYLWWRTRTPSRVTMRRKLPTVTRLRRWHSTLGLTLLAGMLFFSATGLTWSQWAGDNIAVWRSALGWQTPSLNTALLTQASPTQHDTHAEHRGDMMEHHSVPATLALESFDSVLAAAKQAGISATKLEIRPAKTAHQAWTVTEIERRWPTRADMVSINPHNGAVIDYVRFSAYPLAAKLTRWGIDAHMGILFGIPNQLILAAFGLGLCALVLWGYRMWWIHRQRPRGQPHPANTLYVAFTALPLPMRMLVAGIALILGVCLPVMGASLLIFLLIDIVRWRHHQRITPTDILQQTPQ